MKCAFLGNFGVSFSTETHVARSFELAGHEVTRIQEGETKALDVPALAKGHDFFVWTQTYGLAVTGGTLDERTTMLGDLRANDIPSVGFHLDKWWDLPREDQIPVEPFFRVDHLFTADGGHDARFAALGINHHWLPPGVFEPEAVVGTPRREYTSPIAFVGNWRGGYHPESVHRRELVSTLARTYGRRCVFWPRREAIRGQALADLYASATVVVGDSCLVGDAPRYISDRVPETIGRGGFLLHPRVEGVTDGTHYTDREHLRVWEPGDWDRMHWLIRYYLDHPDEARTIALQGQAHVRAHHTYTRRAEQIIEILAKDGAL